MGGQQKSTLHVLQKIISIACILLLAMPFFPTTLTKHQAFAPSSAIWLAIKLKLVKVEFALRPSAKTFESSSWIDQTLGPLSPPFLLENLSGCWTVVSVWNMVSFIFSHLSHQVWPKLIDQKQPSRDIRTYQIDIQAHPSRSDHHKTTSEESESPRIYTHLHMSLKYARSIDLRAHIQTFLSHWAAALI